MRRQHKGQSRGHCQAVPVAPDLFAQTTQVKHQIREQLKTQLLHLNRAALEHYVSCLLYSMGYVDVQIMQHSWGIGWDIQAYSQTGITRGLIICQIRRFATPVPRGLVDELRGTMLRVGARQALLITTSTFSRVARVAARRDRNTPITLLDQEALLDLLFAYQVGVHHKQPANNHAEDQEKQGHWYLDQDFFDHLERIYHASPKSPATPTQSPQDNVIPVMQQCAPSTMPVDGISTQRTKSHIHKGGAMTWRTHMLAGMSSVWLLQLAPGNANPQHFALWLAVAAIGALLPDLDAAQSKIKHLRLFGVKPFHHLSLLLNQTLGHRGLLHSCIGLGLIMLLALYLSLWWGWQSSLALVLGYASHLVTDACTRSGIPWLYPHLKRYHLLPKPWRIVTGSLAEEGFFCLLLIAVALLLLWVIFSFVSTGLTPWNGAI